MARDIPSGLGAAFAVTAAMREGVSAARLRRRDLARPFRGARSVVGASLIADDEEDAQRAYPRTAEVRQILELAAQYLPVMSSRAFFMGITAAVIWAAPIPNRLFRVSSGESSTGIQPVFDPRVLEVGVFLPERAPRGAGVNGHAVLRTLASVSTHPVHGFRVVSPASSWAMLGGLELHPYDLVAIADHMVHIARPPATRPDQAMPEPLTTMNMLTAAVAAGRRVGVAELRTALPRVRTGSASRTETWTRLTLVDAGLPEPTLDHDACDSAGTFVARVDMAYPRWKIAIEYEGSHHNRDEQWESDIERYARLEANGWRIIRVTRTLLFSTPDALADRVRAAIIERSR